MKMSIEEAIEIISDIDKAYRTFSNIEYLSLSTAIDTMRKYQRIESKIKVLRHFTEDTPLAAQRMIRIVNEISEVLENGNDDN